jgi:acetyl esterase/lipase
MDLSQPLVLIVVRWLAPQHLSLLLRRLSLNSLGYLSQTSRKGSHLLPNRSHGPDHVEPRNGRTLAFSNSTVSPLFLANNSASKSVTASPNRNFTISVYNNPAPAESEDCLYLNVYAPASASQGRGRPVMFWLYGGSLQFGHAGQPAYDGSHFASYQDVVVVTTNYRTNGEF